MHSRRESGEKRLWATFRRAMTANPRSSCLDPPLLSLAPCLPALPAALFEDSHESILTGVRVFAPRDTRRRELSGQSVSPSAAFDICRRGSNRASARENAQADCTDMFQSPPRPRVKSSRTGGSLAGGRGKTTLHTVMDGAGRPRASLSHGSRRAFFKWWTYFRS